VTFPIFAWVQPAGLMNIHHDRLAAEHEPEVREAFRTQVLDGKTPNIREAVRSVTRPTTPATRTSACWHAEQLDPGDDDGVAAGADAP
jgi:hypothetical protein